jgi:hypothetical protein
VVGKRSSSVLVNDRSLVVKPHQGKSAPEGQIFHAAGPSDDGWTVMAVHDSQESWERFRDNLLMPRLQAGVDGGFATPPEETGSTFTS